MPFGVSHVGLKRQLFWLQLIDLTQNGGKTISEGEKYEKKKSHKIYS